MRALVLGIAGLAFHCAGPAGTPASDASYAAVPTRTAAVPARKDGDAVHARDSGVGVRGEVENLGEAAITTDCTRKAFLRLILGDDTGPSVVEWIRCGPREIEWGADGGLRAPSDRVTLVAPDGARTTLFANPGEESVVEFEYVRPLALPAPGAGRSHQLAYSVHTYGTGNFHDYRIVDRKAGALREWKIEDPLARWIKLLAPDEELAKQYEQGIRFEESGNILATSTVRKNGDPNCCPSRGLISASYAPRDGALLITKAWRSPFEAAPR